MTKKFFCFALTLILALSFVPFAVSAASNTFGTEIVLDTVGETVALKTGRILAEDLPFYRSLVHAALLVLAVLAWKNLKYRNKITRADASERMPSSNNPDATVNN